ncbi:MAG: glycerate kinase [Epulopiscium sp.]|jgi:glycerate 2-kinase|nr:glycerate kinase [Candidatus Epulonipiscium sp.]
MGTLKEDAYQILQQSIHSVLPDTAVKRALEKKSFTKPITIIAIGKAAWSMASAAYEVLGNQVKQGIVITKYLHSKGPIANLLIKEAGHPIPDKNSILATAEAVAMAKSLTEEDDVVFLISGGGSSLFEMLMPDISIEDVMDITSQLLKSGADIVEMNTIRKHLSAVKGGRFAKLCEPAQMYAIVLSDVLGDRLDTIASGPACADTSTVEDVQAILTKYELKVSDALMSALQQETPKEITNCEIVITGNVSHLCSAAASAAKNLGYQPMILSTSVDSETKEAGKFLASIAKSIQKEAYPLSPPCAIICGGETVVRITGKGKGGRNQELALAAAMGIEGLPNTIITAVGSDGTDGPTDAAGGWADKDTASQLRELGYDITSVLKDNNSYEALKATGNLIFTGPTGTNVNDLYFILCK